MERLKVLPLTYLITTLGTSGMATASQDSVKSAVKKPIVHIVKAGETLSEISQQVYGTSKRWKELYALNKTQVKNHDLIYPETEIVYGEKTVPALVRAPASVRTISAPAISTNSNAKDVQSFTIAPWYGASSLTYSDYFSAA